MEIQELLKDYIVPDPIKIWTKELSDVFAGKSNHLLLTKQTAEIGLYILNKHPELKVEPNQWAAIEDVAADTVRYKKLFEIIPAEVWQTAEFNNLIVYFFGEEKAKYVAYAWERIRFQMYQTGYARRSFRAPENRNLYFINQINFLTQTIPQTFINGNYPDYTKTFFNLSVSNQAKYDQPLGSWNGIFKIWSAALDLGNQELFKQLEDIIFNKDEVGKITRNIIKALLNSEKKECWELVEKLLLAAQRQEGLRQTILEALDETGIGALQYMIKVIIDNKLTRFSSVVRSVDVWAGLGWESERESTVNNFLAKAREFLESPEKIPSAIKSENNTDVYMALWSQGVFDVEKTSPYLHELYDTGNVEKRSLAIKFAIETTLKKLGMSLYYKALDDKDLLVSAWALRGVNSLTLENFQNDSGFPELFEKLHKVVERTDAKEKTFDGKIFTWTKIAFNRNEAIQAMIGLIGENDERLKIVLGYFDGLSLGLREQLTRHILKDFAQYHWQNDKIKKKPTDFQREFAFKILSDKGEFLVNSAFKTLEEISANESEMNILYGLLKRKGANFRGKIIALILKQNDAMIKVTTENLLLTGDAEQRLAGLDIALQMQKSNRIESEIEVIIENFQAKKSVSTKEEILLNQLTESPENRQDYSYTNGYGIWNFSTAFSPVAAPVPNPESYYENKVLSDSLVGMAIDKIKGLVKTSDKKFLYGFSMPFEKIKESLENLGKIYNENKDFEYEVENWNNSKETILLGNNFRQIKYKFQSESPQELYNNYPLPEVWEKWYQSSNLQPVDLFLVSLMREEKSKNILPLYNDLIPKDFQKNYYHNNPVLNICNALANIHPFAEKQEFLLGGSVRVFASLDEKKLKEKPKDSYYSYHSGDGWQSLQTYQTFYNLLDPIGINDEFIKDYWNLANWRQFSGRDENIKFCYPPLILFCRAFEQKIISEDELLRGIMTNENIQMLSRKKPYPQDFKYFERFPFLKPLFEKIREHILNIELKRGDSATEVSPFVASLETIYGSNRLVELLIGLGKTTLNRGYVSYYSQNFNKQAIFSQLLKKCFPLESDTQEEFNNLVKAAKIPETKLIEAAVYAPQWQKQVSNYLNWKGLDSAIWWMHAHTKIAGYVETNSEAESEIAKYSNVDLEDFKNGAVDKDWFLQAYKELGKARWETVYNAAKYISDGNGHRRARLYADVIAGNTKLKEITDKVKSKRDQDYLRIYGLVTLSKTNPEKDVLSRYAYLQQFKKESRQFGSQKQTSEALAVRIALENLARNAGYVDPLRLSWAMETKQIQEILSRDTEIRDGDILIKLAIDAEGKAEIVVNKGDKELKTVPPKFKKDKKYLEINDYKKVLKEQFSRSRKSLEEAMVRGDKFLHNELENLFGHPIISKHLEKLVFATEHGSGFFKNGKLVSANGIETNLSDSDEIRIAHCIDLYKSNEWSDYQRFCFDNELKQPFKQIFRELYLPTEDELKEKSISRRYAGHQVQPKQTVALLKTRGWKVDYEEGLQKVFHKQGFAAKMYAMADWFSPAEVESPTLETVVFQNLKDYKNRPFEEIDARIFSEVMRDIDLVVSVAHAGGVDAEASHSSIEMRSVLLRETLRLFKLSNVEIAGNHAKIKGTMGEYSVHLGSAVVHKAGKYLSILPVHSQHRGRLFLPFADDDPKSAEVMSKVLLLAKDNEIQDPTILRQLS